MNVKKPNIKLYALSTCSHCMRTKKFFRDGGMEVDIIDVDLLNGAAREQILSEVRAVNPDCSFPTILIGDKIVVGFNEARLREALGL